MEEDFKKKFEQHEASKIFIVTNPKRKENFLTAFTVIWPRGTPIILKICKNSKSQCVSQFLLKNTDFFNNGNYKLG